MSVVIVIGNVRKRRVILFRTDFKSIQDWQDVLYRLKIPENKWKNTEVVDLLVLDFEYM